MVLESTVSLLGPFLIPIVLFILGTIGYTLLRLLLR